MKIPLPAITLAAFAFVSSCSTPARETAGRLRNGAVGAAHASELDDCLTKAKAATDAPSRYVVYEDCAAKVDIKYGRK